MSHSKLITLVRAIRSLKATGHTHKQIDELLGLKTRSMRIWRRPTARKILREIDRGMWN